jgi:hypothetical protein
LLHRQRKPSERPFGARLRCSGCHVNGGLLQKELAAPHNDWFLTSRKLPLGTLKPDAAVRAILADLVDAGELSKLVSTSAKRLADSAGYRKVLAARSMQERLRPLFCSVEVNIESDVEPLDDRKPALAIPSGFFVDPRLGTANISVQRQHYDAALKRLHARPPETLSNLTSPQRDAAFHRTQALAFLDYCKRRASDPAAVLDWSRLLAQRRVEVGASESSQNPRGHILEDPGRIVFPSTQPAAVAGRLMMTQTCQVQ